MAASGNKITKRREQAGMTAGDLQIIFGLTTTQAIYRFFRISPISPSTQILLSSISVGQNASP